MMSNLAKRLSVTEAKKTPICWFTKISVCAPRLNQTLDYTNMAVIMKC